MSEFPCTQFCKEDVQLDYQLFIGAATYLLKRIEADPAGGIPKFESNFAQKGHPSYRDIRKHAEWLFKMTQRCCFSVTSFLGALIYVERLRRQCKVALYESTWRSTWVAMSVISEKRWEDNYIHPGHIHNMYGSTHRTEEHQKMQLKLFEALEFNLAIDESEFYGWIGKLRADEKDQQIVATVHFQRIFLPRPIPNLKTKKNQNTPSTSGESDAESLDQLHRQRLHRQSVSQKQYDDQKLDVQKQKNLMTTSQFGYSLSQTPRAHGEGQTIRHKAHHGAATCRRDYHSQLTSDLAPQHGSDLRPGTCARDLPAPRTTDYWQLDFQATELRMQELNHRMQQLNQQRGADLLRTSCWHNTEHQQHGIYQQRHRFAAQRPSTMSTSIFDHTNTLTSWTSRAPQYDMNYPRSSVVAWS